ncbi:alpha-galactosidase [Prevotella sp. E13-17]|uniref:alpha-galactosidase n=1 Tax=Prevotella sp. E13-17 TaxID=2913616 RepID=UPI001EDBED59|nr:alpha-galactosidase [Prevotella sp. E13-17]UKK50887.1 alpha-galactosidase [Prevotella sp. E13-17]
MKQLITFALLLMAIGIQAEKTNISIKTKSTQLVLQVKDDGRLYQTYLGQRLTEDTSLELLNMPRVSGSSSTMTQGSEVYPVMGSEDFYEPAFEIRHADGHPTSILKYVSHTQKDHETSITLRDELYPVTVVLHYVVYPEEDIIKQWSEISHQEKGKVYISRYASSMLYFEAEKYFLTEFSSEWIREMQMKSQELVFGKKIVDSRLGTRSTLFAQPFFEVGLGRPVAEEEGTVLMGTIGWTGNFRFTFEVDHQRQLRVISGINPDASTYLLKKGEVFRTPDFYFTLSQNGAGEGSRRFQRWAINHQLNKGKEDRMTLLNNWENTYFDFDEQKLTALFGEAKDLGVDLFLLDDGWFGNKYPRKDDHAGLGDWQPTRSKLPNGIPYLVRKANETGVAFGIWIEPEMVNPQSELAKKHPDWMIKLPNRETYYFRNQLVLDLANPQVQDFVYGVVDGLMKENPQLKFMKWDCNSPITNIFSPYEKENQGNLYVDYVRGLYRVLQRIHTTYPDLYMMMCSGGGGRSDFEGLKYFTEFWCSDNTDPVSRLYIQWGYSQFMPSKAMCSHVTNWNRQASVKFRLDVDFTCKLGFDIDLANMSEQDKLYCREAIREYNRLKPIIYSPNLYRLVSPYETEHCVLQRVSDDSSHALLFAYDIHPRVTDVQLPVCLRGLDANARYRVREICLMPQQQSWLDCHDKVYTGDYLMKVGLKVTSANPLVSHIVEIVKE